MSWLKKISPQINYVWAASWPKGYIEALRKIYDHELVIFTKGECKVEIDGKIYSCPEGTYLVIPPGVPHISTSLKELSFRYCFHFDWSDTLTQVRPLYTYHPGPFKKSLVTTAPAFVPPLPLHGSVRQHPRIPYLLDMLVGRWRSPDPLDHATCRYLLGEILTLLLEEAGPSTGREKATHPHHLARKVREKLESLEGKSASIQVELASLGHTYAHLCRVFKRQYGISPLTYLNNRRLEKARELLRSGRMTVAEAAYQCGFTDPGYFGRLYKKYTGSTPGHSRN